jgi:hypothetical protein
MPPTIIRKAERYPSGRIAGASPPVLLPKVVHVLTVAEQVKLYQIEERRQNIRRESMDFLVSIGLKPTGQYVFHKNGGVTERGRSSPRY